MKAFKLSLKRLPSSSIENFVKEANSLAIYTLMEKQPVIPKLIERYLRAAITDESDLEISFASEIMDLHQLDSAQKSIIYECELRAMYMLSASFDCSRHQSAIIHTLLRHYTAETYPIRRARFVYAHIYLYGILLGTTIYILINDHLDINIYIEYCWIKYDMN